MAEHLRHRRVELDADGGDVSDVPAAPDQAPLRRGELLRNGLAVGGGLLLGGGAARALVEPGVADAQPSRADRRILRFLLQLEYLQADFYSEASERGGLSGELREFADTVGRHEREHVALLERRLGSGAGARPRFEFGNATQGAQRFARTARQLEETGVAAYIGQGANLSVRTVAVVARITSVEARHAAWIADFLGRHPAPLAADKAQTSRQVQAAIRRLGFLR
jgi:hypothetical protein